MGLFYLECFKSLELCKSTEKWYTCWPVTYLPRENNKVSTRQVHVPTSRFVLKVENKRKVESDLEPQKQRSFGWKSLEVQLVPHPYPCGICLRSTCQLDLPDQHWSLLTWGLSLQAGAHSPKELVPPVKALNKDWWGCVSLSTEIICCHAFPSLYQCFLESLPG